MKEAPGSSETSVLTRATRHNNPEDTILHNSPSFLLLKRSLGIWILSPSSQTDYLYALSPTKYVPPADGDRIQSPKNNVLNRIKNDV
jgi:hypothetical protein